MELRLRLTRKRVALCVAAVALVATGAAIGVVGNVYTGADGVYHGCVATSGALRVLQPGQACTRPNEVPIDWNQVGPQGPQGQQGVQGPKGETGETGPQGTEGIPAQQGVPGPTGETGATGPQGAEGIPAQQGVPGPTGETGETGPQGTEGIPGQPAPPGASGPPGPVGAQGPRGEPALSGTTQAYQVSTGKRLVTPRQRVRGALRAHLPPGRYVIHARVVAYSFKARGRRGLVQCKLRGDTATTHYAVIDWAHAVYSARRPMASETISLVGMHDVTTSGRVKVDCFSRNGGTLGLRKLVAIKVGAGN